jgi:hypothetical protein
MKSKHILFAFLVIFAIGFTSCEKESDPQTLSEFVLGDWVSQDLLLGDTEAHFLAYIEEGFYTLTLVVGDQSAELPKAGYTIDDEANIITIDQPQMPGEDPSDEKIPFTVTWVEGQNTMLWTPDNGGGSDAPTLQWTRGD